MSDIQALKPDEGQSSTIVVETDGAEAPVSNKMIEFRF